MKPTNLGKILLQNLIVSSFFFFQHSLSPEIAVHGIPINNFSRSGSGGVNLSKLSVGLDLKEPMSTKWSSTTSIKFEVQLHFS